MHAKCFISVCIKSAARNTCSFYEGEFNVGRYSRKYVNSSQLVLLLITSSKDWLMNRHIVPTCGSTVIVPVIVPTCGSTMIVPTCGSTVSFSRGVYLSFSLHEWYYYSYWRTVVWKHFSETHHCTYYSLAYVDAYRRRKSEGGHARRKLQSVIQILTLLLL